MTRIGRAAAIGVAFAALTTATSADARPQQAARADVAAHRFTDCFCYDVSVVDVRGDRRTRLFNNARRGWNVFDVSPNQRRLVFSHGQTLNVARITGGDARPLFSGYMHFGVWSPDGKKIAFGPDEHQSCSGDELWVINTDGSNAQHVADCALAPTWSPDSRKLAFTLFAGPDSRTGRLAIANQDGTELRIISTPAPQIYAATWSPRGDWIAYSLPGPSRTVHIVRVDGRDERTAATGSFGSWSPDGKRIAYTHRDRSTPSGPINSIRIANFERKTRHLVLLRGAAVGTPVWSPNGRWIAYSRIVGTCVCRYALEAIRVDGKAQHRLATLARGRELGPIYWSRDSARVVYLHQLALGE